MELKSQEIALKSIEIYEILIISFNEYIISKQLLRSATSVGANISEAKYAYSKNDFHFKINIALKEASETEFWLTLLNKTWMKNYPIVIDSLKEINELIKILYACQKTIKINANKQ